MTSIIERICQKDILNILIGDTEIKDEDGNIISMTYLKGSDIFALFDVMNLDSTVEYGNSRWIVMRDFIRSSIEAGCLNDSLTYVFDKIEPSRKRIDIIVSNLIFLNNNR